MSLGQKGTFILAPGIFDGSVNYVNVKVSLDIENSKAHSNTNSRNPSVETMSSYYVELSLNITFILFVILHAGLLIYVSWNVFWMNNETKTGRIVGRRGRTENVRPLCLGGTSNSGLDFSSISSLPETSSRLHHASYNIPCF